MKKEDKTRITREKILTLAISEFGENGYHGGSMNNICQQGISKGLLYHNFENKDILYLEALRHCYTELLDQLKEIEDEKDLKQYVVLRTLFMRNHESKARMILTSLMQPPRHLQKMIQEIRAEYDFFHREYFGRIIDQYHLREGVSRQEAIRYFSIMQNMYNLYLGDEAAGELSVEERVLLHEEQYPKLLDFMLHGIVEQEERY